MQEKSYRFKEVIYGCNIFKLRVLVMFNSYELTPLFPVGKRFQGQFRVECEAVITFIFF